ncbi:PREDICTED: uncharacterized protein LOC109588335 [Amphimedon queenslandica]|nr:PREDICTED: uncharacterized protein LOC109588335 [Amphimedon queenslandica]|eukprot:XP_019860070.1 PREDICTED: uncharacterized protein LOC109588335 [Amphimedon queenslandica]
MLLGSAGTGKTSLKRSLMEEPFNPHTTSTIVSDVSSVRPFGHEWQTMRGNKWSEATEEDEIEELAHLFKSIHWRPSSYHPSESSLYHSLDLGDTCTSAKAPDLDAKIHIKSLLRRVDSYDTTAELLVQPFLHIWDCGGQPVFLEILPAFLTPRTMFLLLFDASKDFRERWQSRQNTRDGKVLFGEVVNESTSHLMAKWMSAIHSHLIKHSKNDTSSPSIYCIGSRGDKLHDKGKEEVKKKTLSLCSKREFPNVSREVLIIDNTTSGKGKEEDPNITKLREKIDKFITNLVVPTPVNWVLFRKVLQELKQNIISVPYAIAIGVACHIRAADVSEVLIFYHELGVLLYYPQIEGLKNRVILSPKWFVDTIGKVFTLEGCEKGINWQKLLRNNGILVQPLYKEVWRSSGIGPEGIIELLVHFRLAAQVQTELYDSRFKQYFLPAVLPGYTGDPNEVRPGYKLRASPVHITFSTGYVPPGFFTRLATAVAANPNVKLNFDNVYTAAPTAGFFDRLAIAMKLRSKIKRKSIYRNRACFSYGCNFDDFFLTDINDAIQVDVLRYVPESSRLVSFKSVCQDILKLLRKCSDEVENTLYGYHGHNSAQSSSRDVRYVCECESSSSNKVHYIKVDAEKQTCSDPVYCHKVRRARSLTQRESMWFEGEFKDKLPFLKYLFFGVGLFSLIILLILIGFLLGTGLVNINSTTADKENILTIGHLREALDVLENGHFPSNKWSNLGLSLGLLNPKLDAIENNYPKDSERCLQKCLTLWLTEDIEATWSKLADAVDKTGEKAVAAYIRIRKVKNKSEL